MIEDQRSKIVKVAAQVLAGLLSPILGAWELKDLLIGIGVSENDPDRLTFVAIDSETDALPLGRARKYWDPNVLAEKATEIAKAEQWAMEDGGREAFENMLRRFGCSAIFRQEMSFALQAYDVVRVVELFTSKLYFSATNDVSRPPRVGDVAIICHQYDPQNPAAAVVAEMVEKWVGTVWVADFLPGELELVSRFSRLVKS